MSEPSPDMQAPITVRYHREAIERILQSVEDGTYCALLGPRLCGKTVLLRYVERTLVESLGWNCIYIDLYESEASTLEGFFSDLMRHTARQIQLQTGQSIPVYEPHLASSAVFRGFLIDCMEVLQRDLVLIFDNLDAVPTDLVQALLTSLRAAYMDQQGLDYRLIVVVSGALSLATLTVGESSPFRGIARRVFVGDLSENPSRDLIADFLSAGGVSATRQARERLLSATRGDTYLIRKLCQRCVETARLALDARLTARMVNRVTRAFLPAMREKGDGLFINVSSVAGRFGAPFFAVYNASKWAVEWRMTSRPSGSLLVMIRRSASSSIRWLASRRVPSTSPARVALASPGPMSVATSITVTGWSKCFWLPSGSVIAGITLILLQILAAGYKKRRKAPCRIRFASPPNSP